MSKILEFDEWFEINEEEVPISAAETGADREMDYNPEDYALSMYDDYLWKMGEL
jgi:hypothetical protein